jgi:hypothetical protein
MITIFAIPKPFKGHIGVIQRNAIQSWKMLAPGCEVILYGDDEGTAEAAAQYGAKHVPDIARNEFGTPLLNGLFERTQQIAAHELICYVNGDSMLVDDFMRSLTRVASAKKRFLLVGRRWNIDIDQPLDFGSGWEDRVKGLVREKGVLYGIDGIDYFAFRRGTLGELPPFAVGRPGWDGWMIYNALKNRKMPVIDATRAVTCIHQNHDYNHLKDKDNRFGRGPEATRNRVIAGGMDNLYSLYDANWRLDGNLLRPTFFWRLRRPTHKFVSTCILRRQHQP